MKRTVFRVAMMTALVTGLAGLAVIAAVAEKKPGAPGGPPGVELSLEIGKRALLQPDKPGAPSAQFAAVVTATNKTSNTVGVSTNALKFFLFDPKEKLVFMLSTDQGKDPDARPLKPGESCVMKVNCSVTYTEVVPEKPYRLVVLGSDTIALKTFTFKQESK